MKLARMSMIHWPFSRHRSLVDPFRVMWPDVESTMDNFERLRQQMEADMRRRQEVFDRMHDGFFKDFMTYMNDPEKAGIESGAMDRAVGSYIEHTQNGKTHTFKRAVTVNGKTDTITATYDGDKTTVKYDGSKELVVPGFYDITLAPVKDRPETAPIDAKLREMQGKLAGKSEDKTLLDAPKQESPVEEKSSN